MNHSQSQTPEIGSRMQPKTGWQMQKERIVKEDGRFLYYYRFIPIEEVAADRPPAEETSPSHQQPTSIQERA